MIVEAMKTMNPIEAEFSGKIKARSLEQTAPIAPVAPTTIAL